MRPCDLSVSRHALHGCRCPPFNKGVSPASGSVRSVGQSDQRVVGSVGQSDATSQPASPHSLPASQPTFQPDRQPPSEPAIRPACQPAACQPAIQPSTHARRVAFLPVLTRSTARGLLSLCSNTLDRSRIASLCANTLDHSRVASLCSNTLDRSRVASLLVLTRSELFGSNRAIINSRPWNLLSAAFINAGEGAPGPTPMRDRF